MGPGWVWRVVLIAGLVSLAACAQVTPTALPTAPPPAPTSTPLPAPTPTPVVSPAPAGVSGGSLTVAGAATIPHRDVHQEVQESLTTMGPGLAYSRLLRLRPLDDTREPHLLLECDLCESWRLNDDLAYEFQLRPGIRWQNVAPVTGRELNAEDLVFSYDRLRTPGWANASLLASIGEVRAEGDDSLTVELALADADAILALADGHAKIVAPEVVEAYGDLREAPVVGTGPWIWQELQDSDRFRFQRNPGYFERGMPFLDELTVLATRTGEAEAASAAFVAGLADIAAVGPEEYGVLLADGAEFESVVSRRAGAGPVLVLNTRQPPMDSLLVRRAVFRAIDPWDYLDTIWSHGGPASVGIPVRHSDWLLGRDEMRRDYFADPMAARAFMEKTRTTLPMKLNVAVQTGRDGEPAWALEDRIVEDLRAVGFEPDLRRLTPEQFREYVVGPDKKYQVAIGDAPPVHTTNGFLFSLLHSQGRWNLAGLEDRDLDLQIEQQAGEFDDDLRREQLLDIQRRVLDRAYLFSPVTASSRWVFGRGIRGFAPNHTLSEYSHWSRVWLER